MRRRHARGFTLIEMVVAFAILGLSLSVLYAAFESALLRTRHDARLAEGMLLAQSLLARAGAEWRLASGSQQGEWSGFSYTLAERTLAAPPHQPPYTLPTIRVTASVSWSELAGARSVSLSTLKLLPPDPSVPK